MSAVDYSQTLKRTDGWIVESDSFFLTTPNISSFQIRLQQTRYTGQGSLNPFNFKIGTEANNRGQWGQFEINSLKLTRATMFVQWHLLSFYRARRLGYLCSHSLIVPELFSVCLKKYLSYVSFFLKIQQVFLKYCHYQITVYFFNDENLRLFVKLSFFPTFMTMGLFRDLFLHKCSQDSRTCGRFLKIRSDGQTVSIPFLGGVWISFLGLGLPNKVPLY